MGHLRLGGMSSVTVVFSESQFLEVQSERDFHKPHLLREYQAFPKVLAIIEVVIKSPFGVVHRQEIVEYLVSYLRELSDDEERNKYLIARATYFFVSNGLKSSITFKPHFKDRITRALFHNRSAIFTDCPEHKIFGGCVAIGKKVTLLRHLEVLMPPAEIAGA
jgi:hypothetical protein